MGQRAGPKRIRRSLAGWFAGERIPSPEDPAEALTYDAILATRGWGRDEFALASPRFLTAVRTALFAEASVKLLEEAKDAASTAVPDDAPLTYRAELLKYRLAGQEELARIRPVLFPEDDDG